MADYSDPIPSNPGDGVVRGDDKPMPNRGTASGFVGLGAPYGADVSMDATNRLGPCDDCYSDPMDMTMPKGDEDRFTSSGHTTTDPGTRMSGTGSDAMDDVMPDDQRGTQDPDGD